MKGLTARQVERRIAVDLTSPCTLWGGDKSDQGYGRIMIDGRTLYVHRLAYQLHVGPIPRGWEIDHLCHNAAFDAGECTAGVCAHRACSNPKHLDAVPAAVNSQRGGHPLYAIARGDSCRRGHDLTNPDNVSWRSNGKRRCKACDLLTQNARRQRARTGGA